MNNEDRKLRLTNKTKQVHSWWGKHHVVDICLRLQEAFVQIGAVLVDDNYLSCSQKKEGRP
jgi:hypothetical protein